MKKFWGLFCLCLAVLSFPLPGRAYVVILSNSHLEHTVTSGSDEQVYGTWVSNQITLENGAKAELINFPGQNTIQIEAVSDQFSVSRSGTVVTFRASNQGSGETVLKLPATATRQTIAFNDGVSQDLVIADGQVLLSGVPIAYGAGISITGKAVAGLPVVGTVNIKDSGYPVKTSFSAINSDGSYTLHIDDTWMPPFLMWAEGWVNNEHLRLLSTVDPDEGVTEVTVNTTPITTAIVESAIGESASEIDPQSAPIPEPTTVEKIEAVVSQTLQNLFAAIGVPENFDLFQTPIGEVGTPEDQLFDSIGVASNDQGDIVLTDLEGEEFIIDPDDPDPVGVPQEIIDNVVQTGSTLDQISQILSDFFVLFNDPANWPSTVEGKEALKTKLNQELVPDLATGFLHRGEGIDDWVNRLADNASMVAPAEEFIGCAIYRPMTTQFYGITEVEEMPDNHDSGLWVLVTSNTNGKVMSWLTSFVDINMDSEIENWKWYGNRVPFRRYDSGRPRAKQLDMSPGSVVYHSGIHFWHNDVGNLAMNMGITNLAIFNPAFAPEKIDGIDTKCVRLVRREEGLDTRFRLKNVPRWWKNDAHYLLSRESGDRLIDLDVLKSQESIEFVAFGLDDAGIPVRTWIYTIPEPPVPVSDLEANPDHFFATIEQDSISFQLYDENDTDNPDAFPGNNGLFSWTFPNNSELFPSWSRLGWDDASWNWNEYEIDNPSWYEPGDFHDWTSDIYLPGANAASLRTASFALVMRDTNHRNYWAEKRWDPWSDDVYSFDDGNLVFNLSHSWAPENLTNRLGSQISIRDREVNRFQADVKLEGGTVFDAEPDNSWDTNAHVRMEMIFQPEEYYVEGVSDGWTQVTIRIRLEKDNKRWVDCFIWQAEDNDWNTTKWSIDPGNTDFPGTFPLGQLIETESTAEFHTIAIELDKDTQKMIVEFDGQSSAIDLADIPDFDSSDFQQARISTRVENINEPGDDGSITVRVDNAYVNGILYDDFENGFGVSKWYINTSE
jgi:hypothetical protein